MIDLLKGILSSNRSQTENSSTFTSSVAWLNASVAICNLVLEISSSRSGRRTSPIFSNKSTHQIALSLKSGDCKIKTEDPEKSSKAQETIKGTYEGDEITVGYNAEYLKDVVSHVVGPNVSISLSTPIGAALFDSTDKKEGVENTMLLMPIRLND